jgi:hypothetical protein
MGTLKPDVSYTTSINQSFLEMRTDSINQSFMEMRSDDPAFCKTIGDICDADGFVKPEDAYCTK